MALSQKPESQGTFLLALGKLPRSFSCGFTSGARGMMDASVPYSQKSQSRTSSGHSQRGAAPVPLRARGKFVPAQQPPCEMLCAVLRGGRDAVLSCNSEFLQYGCSTWGKLWAELNSSSVSRVTWEEYISPPSTRTPDISLPTTFTLGLDFSTSSDWISTVYRTCMWLFLGR